MRVNYNMSQISIEVSGIKELQKANETAVRKMADGSLVARAALIIERQAKINASGRPGPRTGSGRLRASIMTDIINPSLARVGPSAFYAPFVEFGHRQHPGQFVPPLGKRLVAEFAPAYPFLNPAIEQTREELGDVVVSFGREIGEEWGR